MRKGTVGIAEGTMCVGVMEIDIEGVSEIELQSSQRVAGTSSLGNAIKIGM
jgi:hypothetical protein